MAIERLLLPLDHSIETKNEDLFATAVDIAEPTDATVYMAYLLSDDEYSEVLDKMNINSTSGTLPPDKIATLSTEIQTQINYFDDHDISYEVRGIAGGDPTDQVVRKVDELNIDLVLIEGEPRSPTGKAVFGDRAQSVLLQSPCPVVYVRQNL